VDFHDDAAFAGQTVRFQRHATANCRREAKRSARLGRSLPSDVSHAYLLSILGTAGSVGARLQVNCLTLAGIDPFAARLCHRCRVAADNMARRSPDGVLKDRQGQQHGGRRSQREAKGKNSCAPPQILD
jgi:hypothetical protein